MEPLLQQRQEQSLYLAPQLRQSLEILQAATLDLSQKIAEELQTNPVLEELPTDVLSVEQPDLPKTQAYEDQELQMGREFGNPDAWEQEWEDYRRIERQSMTYGDVRQMTERREHLFNSVVEEVSLQEHLMQQVRLGTHPEGVLRGLPMLIGSLDDRGFLLLSEKTDSLEVLAQAAHVSLESMQAALLVLQGLDPIGLGAGSLQECLLIQLRAQGAEATLAATILRDHFDLLLRHKLLEVARATHATLEAVREALELIATLDPAPGRSFTPDSNQVIMPDVRIVKQEGQWVVQLNETYLPRLRLSPAYKRLASEIRLGQADRRYLQDKIRAARLLIEAIEDRQKTLRRLSQQILDRQKDFFEHGVSHLRPMTMNQMAEVLGVHETTISRALANKYLESPRGLYPLKYFFTSGYQTDSGQSVSNASVKERVTQLIESESSENPYSDQEIVELFAQDGITLARRTIAKYRKELRILPSHLRKRF